MKMALAGRGGKIQLGNYARASDISQFSAQATRIRRRADVFVSLRTSGACSSTGQSIGLRNRGLGVRVPSGAPLLFRDLRDPRRFLFFGLVSVTARSPCW